MSYEEIWDPELYSFAFLDYLKIPNCSLITALKDYRFVQMASDYGLRKNTDI